MKLHHTKGRKNYEHHWRTVMINVYPDLVTKDYCNTMSVEIQRRPLFFTLCIHRHHRHHIIVISCRRNVAPNDAIMRLLRRGTKNVVCVIGPVFHRRFRRVFIGGLYDAQSAEKSASTRSWRWGRRLLSAIKTIVSVKLITLMASREPSPDSLPSLPDSAEEAPIYFTYPHDRIKTEYFPIPHPKEICEVPGILKVLLFVSYTRIIRISTWRLVRAGRFNDVQIGPTTRAWLSFRDSVRTLSSVDCGVTSTYDI